MLGKFRSRERSPVGTVPVQLQRGLTSFSYYDLRAICARGARLLSMELSPIRLGRRCVSRDGEGVEPGDGVEFNTVTI